MEQIFTPDRLRVSPFLFAFLVDAIKNGPDGNYSHHYVKTRPNFGWEYIVHIREHCASDDFLYTCLMSTGLPTSFLKKINCEIVVKGQ